MSKDTWVIQREQLQDWRKALQTEPSIPGDGIDTVKGHIDDILRQMDDPLTQEDEYVTSGGLSFEEIQVGQEYLLRAVPHTKKYLHNIPVKITDKKIKNVTGILMQPAGNFKAGAKFTIPPSSLMKR